MKIPLLGGQDELPFALSGKPDRISQTLFGKFGEEKRWEAMDAISMSSQSDWTHRLLLWMLATEDAEMRERAWEILDRAHVSFDLLIHELSCPMWQVRVGVIRLLAKSGRLDTIRLMIAGIEDYHQTVIDETRRSLIQLIDNAKIRKEQGNLPPEEIHDALSVLFQPLYSSKRSQRFQVIQFLFRIAPLDESMFWEMYLELDLPQFTILHEEFIRFQRESSLGIIYRGLLQNNEHIQERLSTFLAMAIRNSGDNVNYHLSAIRNFAREDFVKVAFVLQHYRLLVEFQGCIKNIASPERIVLFDLLEVVGAEQNLSFLLRCLQLDDARIRIRVLKILGDNQSLGLRNEVFEFLTETDEQVLLATLRYLQKKGDLSTLEKISHLTRSKKKKVKQGVVGTMFKIMKDNLMQKFDQIPSPKRKKILASLVKMKPNFFDDISSLAESSEESDRIKFIAMLESQNLAEAMPNYRKLTSDPNPKVRATAVRGFSRVLDIDVRYKLLRRFFDDPDPRVRSNTIDLLADERPQDESIVELTQKSTRSNNRREKANAIAKLINWGFLEFEANLIQMLDSDEEMTKTSALWALGVTNLPHLNNRLRQAANDQRAPVRKMAVRGIGLRGTDEDVRALMPYLQDPDRGVRVAARNALRTRLNLSFEIA